MAACRECGDDHVEAAARASIAFEQILRLMADESITPEVMLHVYGLMGALLVNHTPFTREEVDGEVTRVLGSPEMVKGLYESMLALGLVEAGKPADTEPKAH
jgi:hypothetical protein